MCATAGATEPRKPFIALVAREYAPPTQLIADTCNSVAGISEACWIRELIPEKSHAVIASPELDYHIEVLGGRLRLRCGSLRTGGDVLFGSWCYIRTGVYLSHLHLPTC